MILQSRLRAPLEQTLSTLPALLSAPDPILEAVEFAQQGSDDPLFHHCHIRLSRRVAEELGVPAFSAGGTSVRKDVALAKAIGEAVERSCTAPPDPSTLRVATFRELREHAVDPRNFTLFHPEQYRAPQFPLLPPRLDRKLTWAKVFSLNRNRPLYAPACAVHMQFGTRLENDYFALAPVSGYAAGTSLEEAVLGGLLEVVERDAFMVFWYNWLRVPGLDLRAVVSPAVRQRLEAYRPTPVRLFASDLTTDVGIPVILAAALGLRPPWPALVVATAASLDPEQALNKALEELSACQLLVREYQAQGQKPYPMTPELVQDQEDHGLLYAQPEWVSQMDPVLRPTRQVQLDEIPRFASEDLKAQVDECLTRLGRVGLEVLVADLTPPWVRELGFAVVKVIIPGAQPIDFGQAPKHLGGPRLLSSPASQGYPVRSGRPGDFNLLPHPFP